MTTRTSRLRGFYKITVRERRKLVSESTGITIEEMEAALETGGLESETADKFVENVLGTYALPFGVALNVRVNGKDYVVPMVVEEPSVIAAASNAAKMVRAGGGFTAEVDPPIMTCQVQLFDVTDVDSGSCRIARERARCSRSPTAPCRASSIVAAARPISRCAASMRTCSSCTSTSIVATPWGPTSSTTWPKRSAIPSPSSAEASAACASCPTSAIGAACACARRVPGRRASRRKRWPASWSSAGS